MTEVEVPRRGSWPLQALVVIVVIAAALGLRAWLIASKPEAQQEARERPVPVVAVQVVDMQTIHLKIPSQGTVSPRQHIRLVAEVSGAVVEVSESFLGGNLVKAGETLVVIDDTDYQVTVADARARLLEAQLNFRDKKARFQSNSLAVQQARAQQTAAEKKLAQAQQDLDNTRIKAPFNALIQNKQADLGQFINTGSTIASLSSTDRAEVPLPLTGRDLEMITDKPFPLDSSIPVTLYSGTGNKQITRKASITRIEGGVDENTRVYHAIATIDDPYHLRDEKNYDALAIGMFVTAEIQSKPIHNSVSLPRNAVHIVKGDQFKLYTLNLDNTLAEKDVTILREQEGRVIISDGLQQGDRVVVTPLSQVWDGMKVKTGEK
jgi:RND family efflux transporter MFP subunit